MDTFTQYLRYSVMAERSHITCRDDKGRPIEVQVPDLDDFYLVILARPDNGRKFQVSCSRNDHNDMCAFNGLCWHCKTAIYLTLSEQGFTPIFSEYTDDLLAIRLPLLCDDNGLIIFEIMSLRGHIIYMGAKHGTVS